MNIITNIFSVKYQQHHLAVLFSSLVSDIPIARVFWVVAIVGRSRMVASVLLCSLLWIDASFGHSVYVSIWDFCSFLGVLNVHFRKTLSD